MYKIDNKNLRAEIINLFLKSMVCFSGCLMSSASLQKLFCGVCSALKCSFGEFVREKVVFPSYSSAIFLEASDFFKDEIYLSYLPFALNFHTYFLSPIYILLVFTSLVFILMPLTVFFLILSVFLYTSCHYLGGYSLFLPLLS